ncbi:MAG TPA: Vms1/Ankzf1 family peptidyl-tRNA hydrolase, partial [Candidatus Eisenbacteria bacterium]|nr:Vms1/Ankzf1 family peptidyl-tRNA hydrolase [Candidatus Eisenbacteria bacterium]
MISREEVERLAALKSGHGILTAYVRLDPRLRFVRRQAVTQFKSALQHARSRVPERWQAALERESARVVGFLTDWEPAGRGIVIFSCTPENLWEVRTLDVLVPNLIDLDTTTKTGLLEQLLEETPDTLVLVLQRDRARLYSIQQGRAGGRLDVVSDVPGQHDQGGWAQPRFQRHIEFHFEQHLEKVVDAIKKLAGNEPVKLILGGTEETVSALFNVLPEAFAKTVIGTFAV